jgi:hypothetical protein
MMIKSYQNKWVILGQELTDNKENREFGQISFAGTPVQENV